jgi:hypothetical protein
MWRQIKKVDQLSWRDELDISAVVEVEMPKSAKERVDLQKCKLDLELDQELEDTFPASDALKITLSGGNRFATSYQTSTVERSNLIIKV